MFYEGTEKRLLICTNKLDLLNVSEDFWQQLVAQSNAEILSSINNSTIKAYLLSESSLFVWANKLLLITCGNTKLINAALFIQEQLGKEQINTLLFQRHQALKPQLQPSSFQQDTLVLEKSFNGQKQHWREDYQGDLFLFGEITKRVMPTQHLYMFHGLRGDLAEKLQQEALDKEDILKVLQFRRFFNEVIIDHFSFKPKGYSLNAITGNDYLTIHLTPEKLSTYMSIETSLSKTQCDTFIYYLKNIFSPERIQQIHFEPTDQQLNITVS